METADQLPPRHVLGKRTLNDRDALFSRNRRNHASEIAAYPVSLVDTIIGLHDLSACVYYGLVAD